MANPKITVEITANGWITIDVPHAATEVMEAQMWSPNVDRIAEQIARAVSEDGGVTRKWVRPKRGLNNGGWTAVYMDEPRRATYLRAHGIAKTGGVPHGNS